jgi:hypothetical protein
MRTCFALVGFLVCLAGCGDGPTQGAAARGAGTSPAPVAQAPTVRVGRWTSEYVCLTLFENGDFELSAQAEHRKYLVMGRAVQTGDALELHTERIWKARYVGACRQISESGTFVDEHEVLGGTFSPDTITAIRLSTNDEGGVRLCVDECVDLTPGEPVFGARWRIAGLVSPQRPERAFEVGEVIELRLQSSGHIWVATTATSFAMVRSNVTFVPDGPDRFRVSVEPSRFPESDPAPLLFGQPLVIGQTRSLLVTRLPGQRISVCEGEVCSTLERQFSSSEFVFY